MNTIIPHELPLPSPPLPSPILVAPGLHLDHVIDHEDACEVGIGLRCKEPRDQISKDIARGCTSGAAGPPSALLVATKEMQDCPSGEAERKSVVYQGPDLVVHREPLDQIVKSIARSCTFGVTGTPVHFLSWAKKSRWPFAEACPGGRYGRSRTCATPELDHPLGATRWHLWPEDQPFALF